jgi:hypothetical protein
MSLWRNGGKSWPRRSVIQMVMVMVMRSSGMEMTDGMGLTDLLLIALRTVLEVDARMAVTIAVLGKVLPVGMVERKMMMKQYFPVFSRVIVNKSQLQEMILASVAKQCLLKDDQVNQIGLVSLRLQSVEERQQIILARPQTVKQSDQISHRRDQEWNPGCRLKLTRWGQ